MIAAVSARSRHAGNAVNLLREYLPSKPVIYALPCPFQRVSFSSGRCLNTRRRQEPAPNEHSDVIDDEFTSLLDSKKVAEWDLTVGLEIHAQLNAERKLFSESKTSESIEPNVNVNFYDLAFPGSQPIFQKGTLIPALRAAIALNCTIQHESRFDRKHYFYSDQPAGYQITQYYHPYAKDGLVEVPRTGFDDSEKVTSIGIKQVQLEQDTAKTIVQGTESLIDYNRVGQPLIEIITLPQLHSPQDAASCANKIMSILQSVDAVTTGMEMGGLRVDVNVSVSPKGSSELGQRTEIKNLSSFKAIEQAIIQERNRQIESLEVGGTVRSETRGWTIGQQHTTLLRGKEGEVDYRYMPDPDIPPLLIDEQLVKHIRQTLPPTSDAIANDLVAECGLSLKDALTLAVLNDGQRLEYFDEVCEAWIQLRDHNASIEPRKGNESTPGEEGPHDPEPLEKDLARIAGNWVIHEIGGVLPASRQFSPTFVPARTLATILFYLHNKEITGTSAKKLLSIVSRRGNNTDVDAVIVEENMRTQQLSSDQYKELASQIITQHPNQVKSVQKGQTGKLKFLIGQMMRTGGASMEAAKAEHALRGLLDLGENQQ